VADVAVQSGRSLWRSGRAVWVLAVVGVAGLVVGYLGGGLMRGPVSSGATQALPPGLLTARVEARSIEASVVARADVGYRDQVDVNPVAQGGVGAAIVTGHVPVVGDVVNAGDVILEVSGSPVFVLPGQFPAYRSLGAGSSGADVAQLRAALNGIGLKAGVVSPNYDSALAGAVAQLYKRAGYAPPGSNDLSLAAAVRAAQDQVTDAQVGVTQATTALAQAKVAAGRAGQNVTVAQSGLSSAQAAAATAAPENASAAADAVTQAQLMLSQAQDAADQANAAVGAATDSLAGAQRGLKRAQEALTDAQRAAWAGVPLGAVVYAANLPSSIAQVNVRVGDDLGARSSTANGQTAPPPLVLAGSDIKVNASVSLDQALLLKVGGPAVLTVPGGAGTSAGMVQGVIASICDVAAGQAGGAASCAVGITVTDLGGVVASSLVGNVQVTMVVGTSSPDSLVVPVAAVSADTAGNAQITIVDGPLVPGVADQKTIVVRVTTGLSAEGMVEITHADPAIKAGDLVVIGQGATPATPSATPT